MSCDASIVVDSGSNRGVSLREFGGHDAWICDSGFLVRSQFDPLVLELRGGIALLPDVVKRGDRDIVKGTHPQFGLIHRLSECRADCQQQQPRSSA